ncbi:peptidoglycan-binding protein [Hominifimenecus sp. rT4P-3]|uniref:peptidoglycan-binding protein n=1 Tax=Hominifimenecus sp. rT4P-3 TaxID=3242979 RepID=UPI003DA3E7FE
MRSEVESLNDELSSVKQRIEELQGKVPLTFTEHQELKQLKEVNKQLELRLALKKLTQNQAGEEKASNARDAITKKSEQVQVGTETIFDENGSEITVPKMESVDRIDKTLDDLKKLEDLRAQLSVATHNNDKTMQSALRTQIKSYESTIKERISGLITESEDLYDAETGMVIEGYEGIASRLENLFQRGLFVLDPVAAIEGVEKSTSEMRQAILSKLSNNQNVNRLAPLGIASIIHSQRDPMLEYLLTASDETIDIIYTLMASNQSDSWTLEDFQKAVDEFQKKKLEISELTGNVNTYGDERELLSQMSSQNSTLTIDQYEKLIEYSEDYADCLSVEGDRITLHEDAVKELSKAREKEIQAKIEEGKSNKYLEYHKLNQELNHLLDGYDKYNFATHYQISSKLEEMEAIASEIDQYYLLEQQLLGTSNAFDTYRNSQSAPSPEDDYNTGLSAMEDLSKGFSEQRYGTAGFEAGARLLIPEDVIDQGVGAMKDYYDDTLKKYFTEDDEGITQFVRDALSEGLFIGDTESFVVAEGAKLQDFVDQLGLTKEAALSLFGDLESFTFGQTFDWTDELLDSSADNLNALEMMEAQALADKAAMIEEGTWGLTSEYDQESTQQILDKLEEIQKAKEDLASQTAEDLVNYATLQQEYDSLIKQWSSAETPEEKIRLKAEADEVQQQIAEIEQGLTEPTEMNIQVSREYLENEIQNTKEKLNTLTPESDAYRTAQEELSKLEDSLNKVNNLDNTSSIIMMEQLKNISSEVFKLIVQPKKFPLDTVAAQARLSALSVALLAIKAQAEQGANFKISTLITTSNTSTENESSQGGTSRGTGRSFAVKNGTAHAKGSWGTKRRETALTGELGQELIVYGDKYWTVGDRGAEFATIPKGAIIFNHRQTEELFKNGYVTSGGGRGKAYARGNFDTSGHAFVAGYGGTPSSGSSDSKSNRQSSSNSKSTSDAKDTFEELVDWIVRKLDVLKARTEEFLNSVESSVSTAAKKAGFDSAFSSMIEQMQLLEEAANRYQQEADSTDLSDHYKALVRSGRIDLEKITDEDLKKSIDTFQDFYDKAQDCAGELSSLRGDIRSAAEDFANLRLDETKEKIDRLDDAMSRLEQAYKNALSLTEKNSLLDQQTQNLKNQLDTYNSALVDANTELAIQMGLLKNATRDQFLSAFQAKEKIDTSSLSGSALVLAEKYNALLAVQREAYQNASKAAADYTEALRENAKAKLENLQEELDNRNDLLSSKRSRFESGLDLLEARGDSIGMAYYQKMQELSEQERLSLEAANRELQALLDREVSRGVIVKNSEDWYRLTEQILDNANAINACTKSILEMQQAMDDIRWENLSRKVQAYQDLTEETDFLLDLLKREDLVEKSGAYTASGLASAGLMAQKLAIARQSVSEYQAALASLDAKAKRSGADQMGASGYNAYMEKRNELMEDYRDAISDVYDYEEDMLDLIQEQLDAQADAYEEILDKRKEALKTAKEESDYQKTIAEQTNSIREIERQLSALEGNDSDYARKRRKQLQADLAKAQEKLEDTEADKKYEIQVEVLDQEFEDLKDSLEAYAKDTKTALTDLTGQINGNVSSVRESLQKLSEETGYQISEGITGVWSAAGNAVTTYTGTVADADAAITAHLKQISDAYDAMAIRIEQATQSMLSSIAKQNEAVTGQKSGPIQAGHVNDATDSAAVSAVVDKNRNYIRGLYLDLLKREPDEAGLEDWNQRMANGMTAEEVRQGIINSEEYRRKHQTPSSPTLTGEDQKVSNVNGTLRRGQKGDDVRKLQRALNGTIQAGLDIDGSFGPATLRAVLEFQRQNGLNPDGNVGPKTKAKFREAGFRQGGIVDVLRQSGEDGLAMVRNGEVILTPDDGRLFRDFVGNMPELTSAMNHLLRSELTPTPSLLLSPLSPSDLAPVTLELNAPLVALSGDVNTEMANRIGRIVKKELDTSLKAIRNSAKRNMKR